jgi:hypothetical protein
LTHDGGDPGSDVDSLVLPAGVAIAGPGADLVTIRGGGATSVLQATGAGAAIVIEGVAITNGGGTNGGGILHSGRELTLRAVRLGDNTVSGQGGGLYSAGGMLRIHGSEIADNIANGSYPGGGGGLAIYQPTGGYGLEIVNTTISGNSAPNSAGGGLLLDVYDGGEGGWAIVNSTITDNTAVAGGGIYLNEHVGDHQHFLKAHNSIIVDNTSTVWAPFNDVGSDNGEHLASASSQNLLRTGQSHGLTSANGNILFSGSNYGGPTRTHALYSDSAAIDAGDDAVADLYDLELDQRGYSREEDFASVSGDGVDIGAVELAIREIYS